MLLKYANNLCMHDCNARWTHTGHTLSCGKAWRRRRGPQGAQRRVGPAATAGVQPGTVPLQRRRRLPVQAGLPLRRRFSPASSIETRRLSKWDPASRSQPWPPKSLLRRRSMGAGGDGVCGRRTFTGDGVPPQRPPIGDLLLWWLPGELPRRPRRSSVIEGER